MRVSEFYLRVRGEFGTEFGDSLVRDHVLLHCGGMTALEALNKGMDPKQVWRALCADHEVPQVRW